MNLSSLAKFKMGLSEAGVGFAMLLLLCACPSAQDIPSGDAKTGTVTGLVQLSDSGTPDGVEVTFLFNGSTVSSATTTSTGAFSATLQEGLHAVRFEKSHYETHTAENIGVQTGTYNMGAISMTRKVAPVISTASPSFGSNLGGSNLVISGSNLNTATSVTVGDSQCSITSLSSGTIQCTTSANSIGLANIVVSLSNGESTTLASGFRFSDFQLNSESVSLSCESSYQIVAQGGSSPYSYVIASGDGTVSSSGLFSPAVWNDTSTVTVTDSVGVFKSVQVSTTRWQETALGFSIYPSSYTLNPLDNNHYGIIHTGGQGRYLKSTDNRVSWTTLSTFTMNASAQDPRSANMTGGEIFEWETIFIDSLGNYILAGSEGSMDWMIRKSSNAGGNWTTVDRIVGSVNDRYIYSPLLAEDTTGTIFAVGKRNFDANLSSIVIRKSVDHGDSWTSVSEYSYPGANINSPTKLVVDSDDTLYLFASVGTLSSSGGNTTIQDSGGVLLKSVDGGSAWAAVETSLLDYCTSASPYPCTSSDAFTFLFGSEEKLFYSTRVITSEASSGPHEAEVSFKSFDIDSQSVSTLGSTAFSYSNSSGEYPDARFANDENDAFANMYLYGDNISFVYRSTDGGDNFHKIFKSGNSTASRVSKPDSSHILVEKTDRSFLSACPLNSY